MKFNITLIIFSFLIIFTGLSGQENSLIKSSKTSKEAFIGVPNDLPDKVSRFFDKLITGKDEEAFQELLNDSPIAQKQEQLKKVLSELRKANKMYGSIKGFEPINSDIVANAYIRLRYLGYHKDLPMRWVFTFYKSPERGWIVTNVKFDDLSEIFFKDE